MIVIGIDPGEVSGFACLYHGKLAYSGTTTRAQGFRTSIDHVSPDVLIVERPRVYPQGKGDPNDLITLALTAGRYLERWASAPRILTPFPHDWKGSVPKPIHNKRILSRVGLVEGADHNMIDAIGLALWGHERAY